MEGSEGKERMWREVSGRRGCGGSEGKKRFHGK